MPFPHKVKLLSLALLVSAATAMAVFLASCTSFGTKVLWHVAASAKSLGEQNYGDPDAPLSRAAATGNLGEFRRLAANPAERRAAGFPRTTARLAAENGHVEVLRALIDSYQWPPNQPIYDHSPHTAVDYAVNNLRAEVVEFLVKSGAHLHIAKQLGEESRLAKACDLRSADQELRERALVVARYLIAAGEPLRVARQDGPDPLYLAIRSRFPEMVALLLQNGASTDGTSRLGTPQQFALQVGCTRCAELLTTERGGTGR